jgi:hypothetical protein
MDACSGLWVPLFQQRVNVIEWTRVRLSQWGRWCRGGVQTGYPSRSAFVRAGEGARGEGSGPELPPSIEEVEQAVRALSAELRQAIHAVYVWRGPFWVRAVRVGASERTLRRRVREAEQRVNFALTSASVVAAETAQ